MKADIEHTPRLEGSPNGSSGTWGVLYAAGDLTLFPALGVGGVPGQCRPVCRHTSPKAFRLLKPQLSCTE